MTLSREADYAVRLVVHMATATRQRFRARELAEQEQVPESFLFKILQVLIKHRLVRSFRGVHGGYQLAVDPAKLTLFRVLEMVEGPIGLNVCVMTGVGCPLHTGCRFVRCPYCGFENPVEPSWLLTLRKWWRLDEAR